MMKISLLQVMGLEDKKQRSRWLENNEPYSIGLRNPETNEWTWVSYARYDPVAGVLAMAADGTDILYNLTMMILH